MNSPICLITGATEGIGKVTALELAKKSFTIVVAARNASKAEALKKEIEISTGNSSCDYIVADLVSLHQVRQLAETFRCRYETLDVLINNAGVFFRARTEQRTASRRCSRSTTCLIASSPTCCPRC